MVVPPARKSKSKSASRVAAITLASCLGGAAILAASPAFAGGAGVFSGNLASINKTDPSGAPLAGAALELCTSPYDSEGDVDGTGGGTLAGWQAVFQKQATATAQPAAIAAAQEKVDVTQAKVDAAQAEFDAVAGDLLTDAQRDAAQAAIDAYAPLKVEQDRLNSVADAAHATWQATVREVLALREAGQPIPFELATRELAEQTVAQTASETASAYRDATLAEADAARAGTNALAQDAAAKAAQTKLTDAQSVLVSAQNALAYASGDGFDGSLSAMWQDRADRVGAQIAANSAAGVAVVRTVDTDTLVCWQGISGADGTISLPLESPFNVTVEEIAAPAGFEKIDGRIAPGTGAFTKGGMTLGGGADGGNIENYSLVNQPTPPVEPPVEPPVTPPVEPPTPPVAPPVQPPAQPETIAYTGGSVDGVALGGIAALLAGAGAAITTIARRRSA